MNDVINGPWEIVEHNWSDTSIYDADDQLICTLSIRDDATEENQEQLEQIMDARARAIAAMPQLLAACERFVWKCENGQARSKESYTQMKAAIDKAMGNEPARGE